MKPFWLASLVFVNAFFTSLICEPLTLPRLVLFFRLVLAILDFSEQFQPVFAFLFRLTVLFLVHLIAFKGLSFVPLLLSPPPPIFSSLLPRASSNA